MASLEKSIAMFKAVLEGNSYEAIARDAGLTRSAVEQRVKGLAHELQRVVGVLDVDDNATPTVISLRQNKDSYLEALERYRPRNQQRDRRHTVTDEDIERAAEMNRQLSNCPNRDIALLFVLFATAAKPLEIARLEVRDYLNEDGSLREESLLRSEVAINAKERPLFFASKKAVAAIDQYLEERSSRKQGISNNSKYRGLDPMSRLFLTDDGHPMPINIREFGNQRHHLCGLILDIYRKIFRRAGLKGVSSLSARRMVARRLIERGCDVARIGEVLGLKERHSVRNLIEKEKQPLKTMLQELV